MRKFLIALALSFFYLLPTHYGQGPSVKIGSKTLRDVVTNLATGQGTDKTLTATAAYNYSNGYLFGKVIFGNPTNGQVPSFDLPNNRWIFTTPSGGGGGGTVTSFSSGNLTNFFTASVANPTSTPALSFAFADATAFKIWGRASGTGEPSYLTLESGHIPDLGAAKITSGILPFARGGTGVGTIGTAGQLARVNSGATGLEYFTPTYLTGNQTITLSGSVTGSGTTSITTDIADNAVGSSEIAADAVTSAKIPDDAIGSTEIAANAVGASELASTAVTAGTYGSATQVPQFTVDADGRISGVSNVTISGGGGGSNNISFTVGTDLTITDGGGSLSVPVSGIAPIQAVAAGTGISVNVVSGTATVTNTGDTDASNDLTTSTNAGGDLSGTFSNLQIVASAVGTTELATSAVTGVKILDGTIGNADIGDGQINSIKISDNSITADDIATDGVGASEISTGAVGAAEIADLSVGTSDLADGSVNSSKLNTDAVTNAKIADNAVGTAEIAADAVTFTKLQNITSARLLGRFTAAAGDCEEITVGSGLSLSGAGVLTATGGGGGATNLTTTVTGTTVTVNSDTGTDATLNGANTTEAGLVTTGAQTWNGNKTLNGSTVFLGQSAFDGQTTINTSKWFFPSSNPAIVFQGGGTAGGGAIDQLQFWNSALNAELAKFSIQNGDAQPRFLLNVGGNPILTAHNTGIGIDIGAATPARRLEVSGTIPIRTPQMTSGSTNLDGTYKVVAVNSVGDFGVVDVAGSGNVKTTTGQTIGQGGFQNITNLVTGTLATGWYNIRCRIPHEGRVSGVKELTTGSAWGSAFSGTATNASGYIQHHSTAAATTGQRTSIANGGALGFQTAMVTAGQPDGFVVEYDLTFEVTVAGTWRPQVQPETGTGFEQFIRPGASIILTKL